MRGRGLPGGRGGGAGALRWLRGRSERRATRQSAYVSPAGRRRRGLLTLRYPRGVREREVAPAGLIRPSLRCDVWADRRFVASFRRRVSGRSEKTKVLCFVLSSVPSASVRCLVRSGCKASETPLDCFELCWPRSNRRQKQALGSEWGCAQSLVLLLGSCLVLLLLPCWVE